MFVGTQGVLGSISSGSFLRAWFHLAFVFTDCLEESRNATRPLVPTQCKLTALNFGEEILLSCRLDSLSESQQLTV